MLILIRLFNMNTNISTYTHINTNTNTNTNANTKTKTKTNKKDKSFREHWWLELWLKKSISRKFANLCTSLQAFWIDAWGLKIERKSFRPIFNLQSSIQKVCKLLQKFANFSD